MRTAWSAEEVSILKENYGINTKKEMLVLLPKRSSLAIQQKAHRLGILNELRIWTEDEEDCLRRGYPYLSKDELLKSLPKKRWRGIRHKALQLGLKYDADKFYKRNWKKFEMDKLSDVDKGYLAGFMDADGSITVKKAVDTRVKRTYYAPLISFYNTDAKLMSKIRDIVQFGKMYKGKRKDPKWKPKYTYNVGSINGVKQILSQITPFLCLKQRRAELVLELIAIKESSKNANDNPRVIEIFQEVRDINMKKRGA